MQKAAVLIAGASGQGINSCGDIFARALKKGGFFVHTYREYPSIIKGGSATMQIDISANPVCSSTHAVDIIVALNRDEVSRHLSRLRPHGILLHYTPNVQFSPEVAALIAEKSLQVLFVPALDYLKEHQLDLLYVNTYLLGTLQKLLGLTSGSLLESIHHAFAKKPAAAEKNATVMQAGFSIGTELFPITHLHAGELPQKSYLIDGNDGIVYGLIASGTRAHIAYPMSPSSGIIARLGTLAPSTGMLVKQAEDEITAINMAIGANMMGTRCSTATSGGGYDLMTEGVSLASITETPLLVVLCQRPGPGTGLPTWTSQGDLLLSAFAAHGDNPKCIMALSHPRHTLRIIGEAWNIAEQYQMPVIVLADKWQLEDHLLVEQFDPTPQVQRGRLPTAEESIPPSARYDPSAPDGISLRYFPGLDAPTFDANSDEHDGAGNVCEGSENAIAQMEKRLRKESALLETIPDPVLLGKETNDLLLVGWGSTRLVMEDILPLHPNASYLHYETIYPLTTTRLTALASQFKKVILIEGNQTGQLGQLLAMHGFHGFHERILRFDGRPFFADELSTRLSSL